MKSSLPATTSSMSEALRAVIKRRHFPIEIMLTFVRWYVAYPLSLRHIEEMMAERGVPVDHATIHRWSVKMLPVLAAVFRSRKHPVGFSWRMDETYILISGQWKYLYRAVDTAGQTIDFLLSDKRDAAAARRFLEQAIGLHGVPRKITIDKSGANKAAVIGMAAEMDQPIELRQIKYLNNRIEQDHRAVKRITRPMLGFKSFTCARIILAGIETMHMIKKGSWTNKAQPRPQQLCSTHWPFKRGSALAFLSFSPLLRQNLQNYLAKKCPQKRAYGIKPRVLPSLQRIICKCIKSIDVFIYINVIKCQKSVRIGYRQS